jgi:hypothetical protein
MDVSFGGSGGSDDGQYSWEAPFTQGWQRADILVCKEHQTKAGKPCLRLFFGLPAVDGEDFARKVSYIVMPNDAGNRLTNLLESVGLLQRAQTEGKIEPGEIKGTVLARIGDDPTWGCQVEWLQSDDQVAGAEAVTTRAAPAADEIPF